MVWPPAGVRVVALSQSSPTAHTHESAAVVVSEAVGAPEAPFPVPVAPVRLVSAPANATTSMLPPYEPELRFAVTVIPLTGFGATASQISAVPGWLFVRWRGVQVKPPPVTEEELWPPAAFGPSEAMKATSRSCALVVVSAPEVMLVEAELWCVLTDASTVSPAALATGA